MIKSVIFDLDGTLLNRDASLKGFIVSQYERLSNYIGHIPKEDYISRFIELDCRGYVWKDEVYQQMVDEFNIFQITWEDLLHDYIDCFKENCIPFPNLESMLEDLKSQSMSFGIITNGRGQFQMNNIEALGIESYFDVILISEWANLKKPNPQIFKKIINELNILPEEGIFVGDHPQNDISAAKDVGINTIWKRDSQWDNVEADFIIDDLSEVPHIVERMNRK